MVGPLDYMGIFLSLSRSLLLSHSYAHTDEVSLSLHLG